MSEVNVKSAQWTPGPWGATTRQGSWDWLVYQEANPNIEICQPFHDGTEFNEVGEANARLIAAAPEMCEALKEARLQIDYMQQKFAVTGTGTAVLGKIDRVIAKAEAR